MRSGKMNDADMEKLEFLVDEYYIPEVVASLGAVCRLRADDIRGTDKEAAKKFETYSDILNDARAKIDAASQG
jgi:glutamate/tyrosine decarboxylase-like PLP-dependent enzyme